MLNLTPHAIVVETDNGRITFEPSGTVARVDTRTKVIGTLDSGIPVVERSYGEVNNVPSLPPLHPTLVWVLSVMTKDTLLPHHV